MFTSICVSGVVSAIGLTIAAARSPRVRPEAAFGAAVIAAGAAFGVVAVKYILARAVTGSGVSIDLGQKEQILRETYGEYVPFVVLAIIGLVVAGTALVRSARTKAMRAGSLALTVGLILPLAWAASRPYTLHERIMRERFAQADVAHAQGFAEVDDRCLALGDAVRAAGGLDAARAYMPDVTTASQRCVDTWTAAFERGGEDAKQLARHYEVWCALHPRQCEDRNPTPDAFIATTGLVASR